MVSALETPGARRSTPQPEQNGFSHLQNWLWVAHLEAEEDSRIF